MTDLSTMLELFERHGTEFQVYTNWPEHDGYTILTCDWGYGVYNENGTLVPTVPCPYDNPPQPPLSSAQKARLLKLAEEHGWQSL